MYIYCLFTYIYTFYLFLLKIAHWLNPRFHYNNDVGANPYFLNAIHQVFKVLNPNPEEHGQFGNEVSLY